MDQYQCSLAFEDIAGELLAVVAALFPYVEKIVLDLKRGTKEEAEPVQPARRESTDAIVALDP